MFIGKDPWSPREERKQSGFNPQHKRHFPWLVIPFILGALSLLTAGYLSTFTPAEIIDGEHVVNLETHQTTIGAALREAQIELLPEDTISPPADTPLNRNDTIIVHRAKLVRVSIDDQEPQFVRTQSKSATDVLTQLGYRIGERDALTVNNQPTTDLPDRSSSSVQLASSAVGPGNQPIVADINYKHSLELTIQEQDNPPITIQTTAPTIGEALLQAGYQVYLADTVRPSPGEKVQSGTHVFISRSRPVSIWVDDRRIKTRTHRAVVADVLADMNVVLYGEDYAKPDLATQITDNMEIRVVRVRHEIVIHQEVIPFDSHWEADSEVELDQTALGQPGSPGVHEWRTLVTYEGDAETKRELIADFVARPPEPKIYKYGTKVVVRTMNTPSGPVQYWRVIHMLATSYSASTAGVSLGASYYGHVRCGFTMRAGIVAVDPRYISLHSNVYVDGYGPGNACDTGSAIVGKRIDLGYDDGNLQLWYRWVDVYLLTPVPAAIRYRLD